ncbi:MAG: FG-GAP-like repeat-containing protein, partial [Thermoanaerobaculaceae bacterium]|nr:FG-GAP-like repeat-containing protein [Thermoanaerobaculaceae bacterium]
AYFTCYDGRSDGGGVHSNSGVPNHAFALMTDGGSYNGYAIAGIGLTKAGKIHYRTLTRYLLSGSDFLDHYNAVKQSCTDLVGTSGITSGDCTEVGKALDATEMDHTWICSPPQGTAPDLCTFGQAPQTLFFDNFEGGGGYWTGTVSRGSFPFYLGSFFATSGTNMLGGDDPPDVTDARLFMATPVAIPPGDVRLQFNHAFGFDHYFSYFNYDGGVLEYSPDGTSWGDLGTLITQGARYNGVLDNRWQNPLGGRSAFGNESWGYTASQVNLAPLAGQSIRVGFRIGADFSEADYGWFIDDVRIYKCVAAQVQVASPNGGESLPGGSTQLVSWTGATSPDGTLEVYYNDGVTRTLLAKLAGTTRSYLWTVPTATTTTGKIEIESKVRAGTEATDQSDATFSITAPAPLPPKVDFNGDGESDILWHHQGDGSLYTWWLQGTVTTAGSYLTPPAFSDTKWQIRGVADFNKDGKQDILWHHQVTGDLYVWYLNGTVVIDGSYLTPQSFSDTKWQIRGVADFDRDGNQDILWHHQGTGDLYVWRLGGLKGVVVQGGSYLNPSRFADTLWQIRAVVDMTKDGKPDLLWHHQGNGDLYLWAMDGYAVKWGSYLTPSRFADTRWQIRRVADFNGDGQLDLLWHHQTNGQLYVWMLQNLVTTAGSYLTPSAFTDVRWQIMPR